MTSRAVNVLLVVAVALVAFAADAGDATRVAGLAIVGGADVVVVGWAIGVRR